jgi:hypothetical protein
MGANFEWPRNGTLPCANGTAHYYKFAKTYFVNAELGTCHQNALTYPAGRFAARWAYNEPLNKVLVL